MTREVERRSGDAIEPREAKTRKLPLTLAGEVAELFAASHGTQATILNGAHRSEGPVFTAIGRISG